MHHRKAFPILLGLALASVDSRAGKEAFVPPEVPTGGASSIGIQVQYEGWVLKMDYEKINEERRQLCEKVLRRPFINTAPPGELSKLRTTVVQADGVSYTWSESNTIGPVDKKNPCHLELVTLRKLTVARFDGVKTHETEYDYLRRTYSTRVQEGDGTYFGSRSLDGAAVSNLGKGRMTGERVVAGVPCTDIRYYQSTTDPTHYGSMCVTDKRPVPGREGPLVLARHLGTDRKPLHHSQAISVSPAVKVDLAVLDGPSGFQPDRASRQGSQGIDEDAEDAPETQRKRGSKP